MNVIPYVNLNLLQSHKIKYKFTLNVFSPNFRPLIIPK